MAKEIDRLMRAAQKTHLGNIRTTDKAIVGIYQRAAQQLAAKAGKAKSGSLTERWLKGYEEAMRSIMGEMHESIFGTLRSGALRSAQLSVDTTGTWLGTALHNAGMGDSFRGVLSSVPTAALKSILDGKMYSDHRSLSKRIWNDTGRLHYGIEEVVSQGIAQKQSAFQLAKALEAYVNPDAALPYDWREVYPDIPFPLKVDYNAQRLARTAINHAYWGANKMAAELNPLCYGMQWLLSDSHYSRQIVPFGRDVCDEYAVHDEGLGVGVYPIDKLPLPHPHCLCAQVQAVPPMDQAVDRLNDWLDGDSDPALDRGFDRWISEGAPKRMDNKRRFMDGKKLRVINKSGAALDRNVIAGIEQTGARLIADFPTLGKLVGNVYLQPEPGIAAFGVGVNPLGIFESGIALDLSTWGSMDALRDVLNSALDSDHTKGTDDPFFIFSHEVGHALHAALALKDIGYEMGGVMTQEQIAAYQVAMDKIAHEAFVGTGIFSGTEYDTPEMIYQSIAAEMGWRGREPGEFIAQAVAMVYNGRGDHPISDEIVRWLKRRLG